jgi:hypothetical protein
VKLRFTGGGITTEKLYDLAEARFIEGHKVYGEFDPTTTRYDWLHEASEEIADFKNYIDFELMRCWHVGHSVAEYSRFVKEKDKILSGAAELLSKLSALRSKDPRYTRWRRTRAEKRRASKK